MLVGEAVKVAVGEVITIEPVVDAEQPVGDVNVTVYGVVLAGEAVMDAVVAPVLHKYLPPFTETVAVNVPVAPAQMVSLCTVKVGYGVIKTDLLTTALQPVCDESSREIK